MTRRLIYVCILLAASALASGLWAQEFISPAVGVALLGLAWMVAHARKISWVSPVMFTLFALISVAVIYAGVAPWLAFVSIAFSLLAWDLTNFAPRLYLVGDLLDLQKMERAHFLRLGLVIGLSALGYLAMGHIRINLTFASAAILALLAVWGISALVYSLRRRE